MGRQLNFYATSSDAAKIVDSFIKRDDCTILQVKESTVSKIQDSPDPACFAVGCLLYIVRKVDVEEGIFGGKTDQGDWEIDRFGNSPLVEFLVRPVWQNTLRKSRLFFQTDKSGLQKSHSPGFQKWAFSLFTMIRKMTTKTDVYDGILVARDALILYENGKIDFLLN